MERRGGHGRLFVPLPGQTWLVSTACIGRALQRWDATARAVHSPSPARARPHVQAAEGRRAAASGGCSKPPAPPPPNPLPCLQQPAVATAKASRPPPGGPPQQREEMGGGCLWRKYQRPISRVTSGAAVWPPRAALFRGGCCRPTVYTRAHAGGQFEGVHNSKPVGGVAPATPLASLLGSRSGRINYRRAVAPSHPPPSGGWPLRRRLLGVWPFTRPSLGRWPFRRPIRHR